MGETIRTLGFYQPFGTLMLYGKLETRWIRSGKKPPYPLGKYLIYTTKKGAGDLVFDWCTSANIERMNNNLPGAKSDDTRMLYGYAIAIGELTLVRKMESQDEDDAFVKFIGEKDFAVNKTIAGIQTSLPAIVKKVQWVLKIDDVKRIEPFVFEYGKQGVGIFPEKDHDKIKTL